MRGFVGRVPFLKLAALEKNARVSPGLAERADWLAQVTAGRREWTLVVELLVRMGYGVSRKDAGEALGKAGDERIDGIIKEDRLGLDTIYIQAKRWEQTVGRPEIQKFAGALQGFRARKGIFITTATFSKEASDYASRIDSRIVLIDGDRLCGLMIDHGVGVTGVATYAVQRIDNDFFSKETG